MKTTINLITTVVFVVAIAALGFFAVSLSRPLTPYSTAASDSAGQCVTPAGLTSSGQVTSGPPYTFSAPSGDVIVEVCVKAGSEGTGGPYYYTAAGQVAPINGVLTGCYTITGFGTRNGSVSGGGTSSSCKTISHVEFYYQDSPSPNPSPSSHPSPSSTPSPTPRTSPSPSPSPSSSPTPTPAPTPTPKSCNAKGCG